MRKIILIPILFLVSQLSALSQDVDSMTIASLKKRLISLKDTARINCLNNLAEAFLNRDGYKIKTKADSAYPYASTANKEAVRIGYKYGEAQSLLKLCNVGLFNFIYNRSNKIDNTGNYKEWQSNQKRLFELCPQVNDAETWGWAYYSQVHPMGFQNKSQNERIDILKNALTWFNKLGNERMIGEVSSDLGYALSQAGEFEKAFDYFRSSLQHAKKLSINANFDDISNELLQTDLSSMVDLYKTAGDYESALYFLRESRQFYEKHNTLNLWGMEGEMGDMFLLLDQTDSAYYYIQPNTDINGSGSASFQWPRLADVYFLMKKYDSALFLYNKTIDTCNKVTMIGGPQRSLMRSYYGKARIYNLKKNYQAALQFAKASTVYADLRSEKFYILKNYDLQSQLFYELGRGDSAYYYLRQYMVLKDSILTRQFLWRLNSYKKQAEEERRTSQINLLNKDNQLKEQKLKQQASLRNSLIIGILLLLLLGVFIFRNLLLNRQTDKLRMQQDFEVQRLENEKKQAELHQRAVELEMQALRAQMNPHFIFNCLSSINRFIFKNDNKTASDYLTRFSRLIRMVLIHSQRKLITLEDELEMLRLYLDLERLRFKDAFDYSITTTNIVDTGDIFISPLLLQPFCENAVWHGLMHKESKGHLNIIISEVINEHEKALYSVIEDDGVGREKAAEMKSKSAESEKSMGLKITTERLALLNKENNFSTFYKIDDILNEEGEISGTRVQLKIKYKETVEEII